MAVTHPKRPGLAWSRFHFALRFLGLTGALAACVGVAVLEPGRLEALWEPLSDPAAEPRALVAAYLVAIGTGAALLALLVEVIVVLFGAAGRRSALGFNSVVQIVLAALLLIAVNLFSAGLRIPIPEGLREWAGRREALEIPGYHAQIDLTREQLFTLPAELRDRLRRLDPGSETTVIVYQRHKTFGNLTDKPDRYDYAAERKVVEKVKDLVELLRGVGKQLKVEVLDVEEEGYEDKLERLTANAPELRKAIDAAPENSLFIAARLADHTVVQQMSFNEVYQLDRVQSKKDNNNRGNLVLLGQGSDGRGVHPFVQRVLNIEQRRPRVGVLVVHELLTTEGTEDTFTLAGLRKTLLAHGFEVQDVVLKKGWERGPNLEAAADTTEESKLERLEAQLESLDEDIKEFKEEIKAQSRLIAEVEPKKGEDTEKKLKQLSAKYGRLFEGGEVTANGRNTLLDYLRRGLKESQDDLADRTRERKRVADQRDKMNLDEVTEARRLTDVKAKMKYAVARFDLLFIPRLTRMHSGRSILPRLHRLSREQAEVVRDFLKEGKPVFACLGPTNEPPGTRVGPELGPPGPDDLERVLREVGFRLGGQTVLFSADARSFADRRTDPLRSDANVEVPPLDFDTPARAGYPNRLDSAPGGEADHPLREGLRVMAHSVGSGFDLRLRFPRPVYFERPGKKLAYEPAFLLTASGWNEEQPFPTAERRPRYTAPKPDDPERGSLDARRRGPFPIGAAAEVEAPAQWGGPRGQSVRAAVIGQGELFCGPQLSPAKERLFLQTANWLLGRDDYLPRADHPWEYPRLGLTPEGWEYRRWRDATGWGLPVLFAYLGFVVLLYRRLR